MAAPISFKPREVDPKHELQLRLDAAPTEHAEALLVAWDVLEEAHRQGILDALHGAIGAKDTIVGILAKYSAEPLSVNALRNLLILAKAFGSVDPEFLRGVSEQTSAAVEAHRAEAKPPSLWQLFRRLFQPEARRGLSLATQLLAALGRSANPPGKLQ
jgi:uncharacterized protein YjgD (DUF1641 family)